MREKKEKFDVVVCGGGLAGFCAAISAARHGANTCIIQDRPVFGGNSSSEIRVPPHGTAAFHAYGRETGIISELLIEERARNHEKIFENGWTNSVWDMILYDMAVSTSNLISHLNTKVVGLLLEEKSKRIEAVIADVANAETRLTVYGSIFIDCTGDGIVADFAGCEYRIGTEAKSEYGELHAPDKASNDVMGSSIHFKTKDVGHPVHYGAPQWSVQYDDYDFFYKQGRKPKDIRGGYWWIEIGMPWDTIHDTETILHELTRHALGVWDWIKNKDPEMKKVAENHVLDWIGQIPGKRESRRIIGEFILTENDIQREARFEDEIAFGGWFVDVHTPGGLLSECSEAQTKDNYNPYTERAIHGYVGPYGIPFRILIARDVSNLLLAGRNVSVTHAAFGSIRVQGTTSLLGQAAGIAAAISLKDNIHLKDLPSDGIEKVQQTMLRDGCFLLNNRNKDPEDLALSAKVSTSSEYYVEGCGPESICYQRGLDVWRDQHNPLITECLDHRRGQLIAVGCDRIDSLSVCLTNLSNKEQDVKAEIYSVEHIWDYRSEPSAPLAETILNIPQGEYQWITWKCGLSPLKGLKIGSYFRLDLLKNPEVEWHISGTTIPGHVAMFEIGRNRMRCYKQGVTMSFRIDPPQPSFPASNVINGYTRPYKYTNLWRSGPNLPHWIELSWETPVTIKQVELTFPGNLLREYHAYGPYYRDSQCACDYSLDFLQHDSWRQAIKVENNYKRHRKHLLNRPITTKKIRTTIHRTNGDPCAALYEVRCYS